MSQDTTAAGRWSLLTGTDFLNAGKWPYIDREGSMWWGYQDNVFVLKQSQLSKITVGWRVILQDSTGTMWFFGHHSDSLIASRYNGTIREITRTQVKWNLIVSPPAVVDGKGRFWMRAKPLYRRRSGRDPGYGIFEYSNDHWFHHTTKTTGLKHDRIHDMAVDREGHPWAATYRSVSQYRYGQWHNYGREDGLSNERVYHIARDKNGDLWCTHGGHGNISVFNGKTWRVINKNSGLLEKVHTVFCARDGARWFGVHYDDIDPGQSGLVRFDGQSWLSFAKRDGLPGNRIWEISELPDGKLLLRIRNPTLAVFESDTTPLQISDQALVVFEPDTTRWARVSGYVENRDGTATDPVAVSLTTPKGHVKASTVTNAQGFYEMRVLPGEYRIQVPDAWGGERDIVVAPGETVSGVDIRPFWFINSATRKVVFVLVFLLFTVIVLIGLFYIVIRAIAVQPLKAPELSEDHNSFRLRFHGNGSSLFGIFVINVLLTLLTLGVYYFWGKTKIRRYMHSQTELHNSRFSNHTTGGELCVGWIKAILLLATIVLISEIPSFFWEDMTHEWITTLAFYGLLLFVFLPLAIVGSLRFRLSRTSYQGIRFSFRGNGKIFFKIYYTGLLKTIFTLGLYYPYFETEIRQFLTNGVRFGTGRFEFAGTGRALFWYFVLNLLLTPFTLGLCWYWYSALKTRYYWSCTTFEGISLDRCLQSPSVPKNRKFYFARHFPGAGMALGCGSQQQIFVRLSRFVRPTRFFQYCPGLLRCRSNGRRIERLSGFRI